MTEQEFLNKHEDGKYFQYDQYGDNRMPSLGPVGIISLRGAVDLSERINASLIKRRMKYLGLIDPEKVTAGFLRMDYRIPANLLRFSTGEAKAVLENTVRGHDLFIICDITNYSITYKMRGFTNRMSPDDHYQDLKRVILAASGKARRINVIMPYLYEGRQHRRNSRESLDCAYMLEELFQLGVSNFITFDAHDDRVANAVPTQGFESIPAAYQFLKSIFRNYPDLKENRSNLMVVSPDEGAIGRSMYYASMLGVQLGTFYKRRDYSTVENGRNPIIAHEFLGDSVEGKDIIIIDDMISSGESMLDLAKILKAKKANRILSIATFALFTDGIELFEKAYQDGLIDKVFGTNLSHHSPELLKAEWFENVNMAKFIALLIDAINHNASMGELMDPTEKIEKLMGLI